MRQPCLDCGTPSSNTRCPTCTANYGAARQTNRGHKAHKYGAGYRARAAHIRATATICHICGQGPKNNDPWQADHLIQGGGLGSGADGPLAAAHRSCNIARSNRRIAAERRQQHHPDSP